MKCSLIWHRTYDLKTEARNAILFHSSHKNNFIKTFTTLQLHEIQIPIQYTCPTKYTQARLCTRVRTLHTMQENSFRRKTEARAYHLSQCITREELASLSFSLYDVVLLQIYEFSFWFKFLFPFENKCHYLLYRHECFTEKYTTRKIHKNYIRDPSGLFSIISHVSLSMT